MSGRTFFVGLRGQEEDLHRSVLVARGRLRRRDAMRSGAKGFMGRSEQATCDSGQDGASANLMEILKGEGEEDR
eukprot:747175-Hanusia_phi.AAC.3